MQVLFVMDPLDTMIPDKDTTLAFMRAATSLGFVCLHCLPHELWVESGRVHARVRTVNLSHDGNQASGGNPRDLPLRELDAVMIRKDPPFDIAYLHATQLLELARHETLIVNDPRALRDANEKLYALQFAAWMPRTVVSASPSHLLAFVDSVGGTAVIKPLDGAGGRSVLLLRSDDLNARSIVDLMTDEGTRPAMVQAYLPEVRAHGDKRVLLLNGELLGSIARLPHTNDMRANIHAGGRVQASTLTAREESLVKAIAPRLRSDGLFFVGLDIIGEHLTEVNVTSPTGIQELSRFTGVDHAHTVMTWLATRSSAQS